MPATMLKNKSYVQAIHSQCHFCKLKMLYMFKTFVSLLCGLTAWTALMLKHSPCPMNHTKKVY